MRMTPIKRYMMPSINIDIFSPPLEESGMNISIGISKNKIQL